EKGSGSDKPGTDKPGTINRGQTINRAAKDHLRQVNTKMGAIAFSTKPEHICAYAGWVLRQIMDDTASQHPEDSGMAKAFEGAKAIDGLIVYNLPAELADRVTKAIEATAERILSGTIRSGIVDKPGCDARTFAQYRTALKGILEAIPVPGPSICGD